MASLSTRLKHGLNGFQLLWAYARMVRDLSKVDSVLDALSKMESDGELEQLVSALRGEPGLEALIADRPSLGQYNLNELAKLPEGTLGKVFADAMLKMGYNPNYFGRQEIRTDEQYVSARLRETHDLWHMVTGFDTSPAGELGLQAFYAYQVRGPLPAFLMSAVMLNALIFASSDIYNRFEQFVMGWQLAQQSTRLLNVRWEELLHLPLGQVRQQLNLPTEGVYAWYRGQQSLQKAA